jgi:hypothetical protein
MNPDFSDFSPFPVKRQGRQGTLCLGRSGGFEVENFFIS